MFAPFYAYTAPFVRFTAPEKQIIESHFTFRQVPKKFCLQPEHKTARELYFINKGLLRLYYTQDGKDITAFIFREYLFAG